MYGVVDIQSYKIIPETPSLFLLNNTMTTVQTLAPLL